MLEQLRNGKCQMVIGTHALFQDEIYFDRLGLVIVDEQHRFGVAQRLIAPGKRSEFDTASINHDCDTNPSYLGDDTLCGS